MAGTGGGGSGSRGGDNNEERLRKMVGDHLRALEMFAIDIRTLEGLASLTTILGHDALLGHGVNPLEGSPNVKLRKLGPKGTLPASNSRKG
jgi:hypothetical protein